MSSIKQVKRPHSAPRGFTLVEIIVVIALISITLAFVSPRFQALLPTDPTKKPSRWIMLKVPDLKQRARLEQKLYLLHVDLDDHRLWVSHAGMTAEQQDNAVNAGLQLPAGVRMRAVELVSGRSPAGETVQIRFSPQGYSDLAALFMETDDGTRVTFLIRPFLTPVERFDGHLSLEEIQS